MEVMMPSLLPIGLGLSSSPEKSFVIIGDELECPFIAISTISNRGVLEMEAELGKEKTQ
jgi:hypothetical protein